MSKESELAKAQNDLYKPIEGEQLWQKRARVLKQQNYSGSFLPPMDLEPLPYERARVANPMSPADRVARKQFFQDLLVSKSEPRPVPALHQRNIFRKTYLVPWRIFTSKMGNLIGVKPAAIVARIMRVVILSSAALYAGVYFTQYKLSTWDGDKGSFHLVRNKQDYYFNENVPEKDKHEFYDRGFSSRTSHRDGKTSSEGSWGSS